MGAAVTQNHKKKLAERTLNECYQVLKSGRKPANFRELLAAGWEKVEPAAALTGTVLANLYTALNLDARFEPVGKGQWGLTEWRSRPARPGVPTTSLMGRTYDDERHFPSAVIADSTAGDFGGASAAAAEETFVPLGDDSDDEDAWDEINDSDDDDYDDDD